MIALWGIAVLVGCVGGIIGGLIGYWWERRRRRWTSARR